MTDEKRPQHAPIGCVMTGSRNRVLHTRCATKKLPENQSNSHGGGKLDKSRDLTRCSAIVERPRCRVRYSFHQKWKTGTGRQYFTYIIGQVWVAPTNHSSSKKTRLNDLSDSQTDRQNSHR